MNSSAVSSGGKKTDLKTGDAIILPAGTGHKCMKFSEDFLCVGAYPQGQDYDLLIGRAKEMKASVKKIAQVSLPARDPIFGKTGFLKAHWK